MHYRLAKISYRSRYRSTKEMDLIFRQFWEIFKKDHAEEELGVFEELIEEDDIILYKWISGSVDVPEKYRILVSRITTETKQKRSL